MSRTITFGGKQIFEPGVSSIIKSGMKNPPRDLDYGVALIIDTGSMAGFGSGSGVDGELLKGLDALQAFDNIGAYQEAIHGGIHWALAKWLFQPKDFATPGVSKLYLIKAATTVAAKATYHPTGGGSAGGTIEIKTRNEGLIGNGDETDDILTSGYAFIMVAGTETDTYKLQLWKGGFRGLDDNDDQPWDNIPEASAKPILVAESSNYSNIETLYNWMLTNVSFQKHFTVSSYTKTGTGAITAADLALYDENTLFAGGTETYDSDGLNAALLAIKELRYTFILADEYGTDGTTGAAGTNNMLIFSHIINEAKYEKFMIVGGGNDDTEFDATGGSIDIARGYDSDRVIVVHGGFKKTNRAQAGFKLYDSIFKAAAVLGRICGLEPQVPLTFKDIDMDADRHTLNDVQRKKALEAGVLHTKWDFEFGKFIVNQGINSLQDNFYMVNDNGTSYEISVKRISAQLNLEIEYNAKRDLLGQERGVNRNTLSPLDVKQWTEGYLQRRTAMDTKDNLILSFQNVTVEVKQDSYYITYGFVPNYPVNRLLFTGFMLDPNA
jgi:hypothetical protein